MITVNPEQRRQIEAAAVAVCPQEMCGLLTHDGFIQCDNTADDPLTGFRISARDYAAYHAETIAVVHTHVPQRHSPLDPRTPSYADIVGQRQTGLPWLIYACDGSMISADPVQLPRVPNQDYLNRPFIWFINDCYSLVQDYYRFEFGIVLPDHKADKDYQQIRQINDLFIEHIEDYGFKVHHNLEGLKNGDLLLLDRSGFKRNHLGIYHDGSVLHQDGLSVKQPISDFYGRINCVLKHEN